KDVTPQRCGLVGGLREAMIKGTPSCTRDVDVEAIIGTAAVLATIEAEAQKMPLHPPRLRDAVKDESSQAGPARVGAGRCAQERRHIARGEEAETGYRCPVGLVDELVDAPRLEAAFEPDVLRRRFDGASGGLACKAPARAWNERVLTILPVTHQEASVVLLPRCGRQRPVDAVSKQARRLALVWSNLDHRFAAQGLAALHGRRCGKPQQLGARVDIPLPADGGDGVAAREQEAVARMRLRADGCIGWRAIQHSHDAAAAAVWQFD